MTRLRSPTSLFLWVVSAIALIAGEARGQDFVWAKSIGGGGLDYAFAVTTDAAGSVIAAGVFRDTVDFAPGPGAYNLTATKDDAWVAKLDAGGSFVWANKRCRGHFENQRVDQPARQRLTPALIVLRVRRAVSASITGWSGHTFTHVS